MKCNWIQAIFGGGLKCDSKSDFYRCISVKPCGRSNWISKCLSPHSQRGTQRQRQIQSDGSASEWLSRIHAATSRMVWKTTQRTTATWHRDCSEGEMMNHIFLMLLCWKAASPAYVVTETHKSLTNNSADSLSERSDLRNKSDLPAVWTKP